jgi:hypothetical protein
MKAQDVYYENVTKYSREFCRKAGIFCVLSCSTCVKE